MKSGPLEEQSVLLTVEPSLQALELETIRVSHIFQIYVRFILFLSIWIYVSFMHMDAGTFEGQKRATHTWEMKLYI